MASGGKANVAGLKCRVHSSAVYLLPAYPEGETGGGEGGGDDKRVAPGIAGMAGIAGKFVKSS